MYDTPEVKFQFCSKGVPKASAGFNTFTQLLLTSRFPSPNNKRCSSTVDTIFCDCYFASARRKEWKPLLSPSALFCNTVTKLRKSIIRINSPATVQADPLKTFSSPANWWPRLSRRTQETPQHMAAFQPAPPPCNWCDTTNTARPPTHTLREFQKPPTPPALQKKLRSCASDGGS